MIGLIGNGLIGRRLRTFLPIDHVFTRENIEQLGNFRFDTIYCAAPSGNRIWAEKNPELDTESTRQLMEHLISVRDTKLILISTGDTQIRPDTTYGRNRLNLENHVKNNFRDYHIIRLPSLIGHEITKNMLYDIKHKTPWIKEINGDSWLQWYPLDQLWQDLDKLDHTELNLCSEPIQNREIVENFAPTVALTQHSYKLEYNLKPYSLGKQEIFYAIEEYLR